MSEKLTNYRRLDRVTADRVQYGLSLLYLAGAAEARQFMALNGIPDPIIERVLSAQYVRGAKSPVRIVVNSRRAAKLRES
ncbi:MULTISPECIES: hypothetical protein [unclassified Duganella]|uniref:hypothetical protein n=1 Tax=unclassified Duganella TaxID=2636909 RepID=UPI0012E32F2B|nr:MULTISPECIES: hypothetical protein [unclassified Duganella]